MKKILISLTGAMLLALSACTPTVSATSTVTTEPTVPITQSASTATTSPTTQGSAETAGEPQTLTILTHDSFSASEGVIAAFEKENNVKLSFIKGGDTGATVNRAIISKNAPLADVIYGVDNTFFSRAETGDILESYQSPQLVNIPDSLKLSKDNLLTPVDYGDVCINYDKAYFKEKNLTPPQSLLDLTKPEYKGLLVIENPATSSPGLAFMLATISEFGVDTYLDFWKSLKNNDLLVVNDWEAAYYTHFSGSSGKGPRPMVLSYGTSPAVEVVYADPKPADAPTASLVGPNMCFRQIEFVGILKGTNKRELAEKFIDFMLDTPFQNDIPLQMFVFPANKNATLPEEFVKFNQIPEKPASIDPQDIAKYREEWTSDWEKVVIR
ncbi:MAG: thiamine ABC transporter substrate-binding protein [Leptolinea sp.]|jgi:thiamine transport system substrate-binding protein|nr:thiamine ABC transporter substrate-binding protein [Leptolinea sp.]